MPRPGWDSPEAGLAPPAFVPPADNHLHTQFSYDAHAWGDMEATCARALALGVPSVAFTEHVDFLSWSEQDAASGVATDRVAHRNFAPFDLDGYLAEIERCRHLYPQLRILTGVEAGEPHLFSASLQRLLGEARPQRVLGSVHALVFNGTMRYANRAIPTLGIGEVMRRYLEEVLSMVTVCDFFEVLAHVDFISRYWPSQLAYDEGDFEDLFREIFTVLAGQQRVLELNTKTPLGSGRLIRWWYEQGGGAVSFGSDAHNPYDVADLFEVAVDIAEAAGFRPGRDRFDFWRR